MLQQDGEKKLPLLKIKYKPNCLSLPIRKSADAVSIFRKVWNRDYINVQEQVYILFLNGDNRAITYLCLNTGSMNYTVFDIKLAMACALGCLAGKIIIAHNHPSGRLTPSLGDIAVTKRLLAACCLMDIALIDHVIINQKDYYSFKDNDLVF